MTSCHQGGGGGSGGHSVTRAGVGNLFVSGGAEKNSGKYKRATQ